MIFLFLDKQNMTSQY